MKSSKTKEKYKNQNIEEQYAFTHRMIKEQEDLNDKISKYTDFNNGKSFDDLNRKQKHLLKKQLNAMHKYFNILNKRINLKILDII